MDFPNDKQIENKIREILNLEKLEFKDENPDINIFDFQITVRFPDNINITVAKMKEFPYKIDIVSTVKFSPIHIDALKNSDKDVHDKILNDIFLWLTPREPEFFVDLYPEKNLEQYSENFKKDIAPFYIVKLPIYSDELTMGNFMRTIRLVMNSSKLARRLIQLNLNEFIDKSKVKALEDSSNVQ